MGEYRDEAIALDIAADFGAAADASTPMISIDYTGQEEGQAA